MALRTFKTETLTGEQAMLKLRGGINDEIKVQQAVAVVLGLGRSAVVLSAPSMCSLALLECM
jgi:hypothetical protein